MRLGPLLLPLALGGLSSAYASSEALSQPESFLTRHLSRAHRAAVRRSSGLAADLRLAFASVLSTGDTAAAGMPVQQRLGVQKPYCVSAGRGTSPANGAPGATTNIGPTITRTATRSATVSSVAAPTQTYTSEWKLWKDYVRAAG